MAVKKANHLILILWTTMGMVVKRLMVITGARPTQTLQHGRDDAVAKAWTRDSNAQLRVVAKVTQGQNICEFDLD